ncbi:thrombospondin type 3 repeat-containing protein [Pseudidiomarina sediminum]|uniref:thrombospondin type 3 repeat-containing protein n=1 Tax=Pseudidiomarina sediminum TaxID=431675 RepID=UPI001C97B3D0|nr:thrombospondin type 3 repeat-containing protein [Pseudidiomarina sediminum]MBY6063688.1 thrombospondin type 3 repeat-containing protein [Pseudidiomarina sediminum]
MKWLAYVVIVVSIGVIAPAHAQKVLLEVSGQVQGVMLSGTSPEEESVPYDGSVLVRMVFDTAIPYQGIGVNTVRANNNLISADVVLFDGLGEPLTSFPMPVPTLVPEQSATIAYDVGGTDDEFDVTWELSAADAASLGYHEVNFFLMPIGCEQLFQPGTGWPMIYEISPPSVPYYLSLRLTNADGYEQINVIVDSVSYSELVDDVDNDGVPDEVDVCPESLLTEFVHFDSGSSGVPNYVDEDGCSIMDHYANCEATTSSSGAHWFSYSGPSQCEIQVGYQLYRDGLIDYTELRLLRNAM